MSDDEKKKIEDRIEKDADKKEVNIDPAEHPLKFIEDYTPGPDEISKKGDLKRAMTTLFASANAILEIYGDELDEYQKITLTWLKNIEERQISVEGQSREDYKEIYKALLGSYQHSDEDDKQTFMESLFSAESGDKDE